MNEWICSYLIKNTYNHNIIEKISNYTNLHINRNNIYIPNLSILNKKYYFNKINISNINLLNLHSNIPKSFLEEIE